MAKKNNKRNQDINDRVQTKTGFGNKKLEGPNRPST